LKNTQQGKRGKERKLPVPLLNTTPGFGITINELSIFNDDQAHYKYITEVTD
jgi:hypothetical protein